MNPRSAPLTRILDGIIELGWLFAILSVPTFFNLRDARIFEPDKIVLLRDIVILMVIAFLLKTLYTAPYYLARWMGKLAPEESGSFALDVKTCLRRRPTVVAALIFAFIYLLATFDSLLPSTSFWGSYDRMEGTYTYLTYITLFLLMAGHLRSWTQFERVVTAIILSSIPCAAYSWVQRFNMDPLVWGGSGPTAAQRTPSTLGNPIFEAAFLLMTVPFTLHRLVLGVSQWWQARRAGSPEQSLPYYAGMAGYASALVLQLGAIAFSGSRGPGIGFLAGLLVFGLALAVRQHAIRLLQIVAACAVVLVAVFGVTNTVLRSSNTPQSGFSRFLYLLPSESGTSEVRSLLWNSAPDLVKAHPVLGCGPEVLLFCWYPYYPSGLRSIELANAAPDRSHNEDIDIVLTTGILGALAYLALIASIIYSQLRLLLRSSDLRSMSFAAALLAMLIGHMVEAFVGIAFSATLLLIWCLAAMSTALASGAASGAACRPMCRARPRSRSSTSRRLPRKRSRRPAALDGLPAKPSAGIRDAAETIDEPARKRQAPLPPPHLRTRSPSTWHVSAPPAWPR